MKTNTIPKSKTLLSVIITLVIATFTIVVVSGCSTQPKTSEVAFNIDAPGWTDESTAAIAHLTKSDDESVDIYQAFTASDNGSTLELDNGEYTVEWIVPVNADRTTYEAVEPQTITVEPDAHVDIVFTAVPAEQMTAEKLDTALSEITTAKDNSNGAISDEVVTRATELVNTAKAAIAAEEQAKAEAEAKAQAEAEAAAAEAATQAQSSNSGYSNAGTQPSGGNGGGGSSTAPSNTGSGAGYNGNDGSSSADWQKYQNGAAGHKTGGSDNPLGTGRGTSSDDSYYD